jgi:YD repeat-containing protein
MQSSQFLRGLCVLAVLLALASLAAPTHAQEIRYIYDALNRLVGVVDQQGNAAFYEYDAVGNLLRIQRFNVDPSANVSISLVTPNKANVGTTVQIFGKGFSPTPGQNTVTFSGGATATVMAATGTSLTTTVPSGAITGPIAVTAPLGSAVSPEPFTILQALAVVPYQADVALGGTVDLQATLGGTPTNDVTWRVNGIVGGNATLGTITAAGTYTAPNTPPPVQPVPIEAVLTTDPTQLATASVRVVGQVSGLEAAAPVSVQVTPQTSPTASAPVSVAVTPSSSPAASGPVSVAVTPQSTPAASGPLAVTGGPVIASVAPNSGAIGATGLGVTLSGANLQGASTVRFLRNGSVDATLTASSIVPAGDGTSVSFSLTISGSAATGSRVVQVVTPQGTSTNFDLGTNGFTVTP